MHAPSLAHNTQTPSPNPKAGPLLCSDGIIPLGTDHDRPRLDRVVMLCIAISCRTAKWQCIALREAQAAEESCPSIRPTYTDKLLYIAQDWKGHAGVRLTWKCTSGSLDFTIGHTPARITQLISTTHIPATHACERKGEMERKEGVSLPSIPVPVRILHETSQHPTPCLQQRMPDDDLQEPLQPPSPLLDDAVVEAIQVHFARQWGDANARGLPLKQIAEDLEVGVAAAHFATAQLEGGNVGGEADEVSRVAGAGGGGGLMGLRVCYLYALVSHDLSLYMLLSVHGSSRTRGKMVWFRTSISRKFSGTP